MDGVSWSEEPAVFAFEILPPWYRTWWARLGALALVGLALYAVYRVRVAVLLRLERQRTRIAMDLHDEMGSGLGGIGILAGVLGGDDIDDASRTKLAGQISSGERSRQKSRSRPPSRRTCSRSGRRRSTTRCVTAALRG